MEPEPDWYLGEWTCKLCQRKDEPGSTVRVRCAETGVDLCVKCLISGAEAEGVARKKGDAYYVADSGNCAVFEAGWTAREELRLLDAIERFGLGNWKEIADHIGGGKGEKRVEEHYLGLYCGRFGHMLPAKTLRAALRHWA